MSDNKEFENYYIEIVKDYRQRIKDYEKQSQPEPGPWKKVRAAEPPMILPSYMYADVVDVRGQRVVKNVEPATAYLIAAAPEMLEALKMVQRYHLEEGASFHLVDAAIEKAEGRE